MEARESQLTPEGMWRIWLVLAGRGWGKTRTGAEDVAHFALWNKGARIGVVAPTQADARDTCVEGESGLLKVLPRTSIQNWNRSLSELILVNESRFKFFSSEEPERLRGPQFHRVWADEVAAWKNRDAFDQVMMGLRLGQNPQLVITTTPKPVPLIKELAARSDVVMTRGKSEDNQMNLAAGVIDSLRRRYGGTRLARQELDVEKIVVAIDPAVTSHAGSDETGLIVAARDARGHFYVLADASGKHAPEVWARLSVHLYEEWGADVVVGEVNEGGDLIARMLRLTDADVPFKPVRAMKSKGARAFPVAALYEQGRVHHVGTHTLLEDQMCRFTSAGITGGSPDRVDALVWAITELMGGAHTSPRVRGLSF